MSNAVPFDEYFATLGRLTGHIDPTGSTPEAADIKAAVHDLEAIPRLEAQALTEWVEQNPHWVPVLALVVGLSREKLTIALTHQFGTGSWVTLATTRPADLVSWLDTEHDIVRLLTVQQARRYEFADVLNARAASDSDSADL